MRVLPLLLAAFLISAPLAVAQLGEIAGQLNFAVQIGHNQTLQMHLLNEGNASIRVQVTAQHMQFSSNKTTQANQTTPAISITPENVTVPAYGTASVNVTVSMPLADKPNWASWQDIISAQEQTNATNSGGALILQGVAKLVSVYAIPSTTTTTSIPTTVAQPSSSSAPSPLSNAALPIAVIIVIIIIAIAYYYSSRAPKKRPSTRKAKRVEQEEESRESIQRDIERLRKEKARLQAEVGAKRGRRAPARRKPVATRRRAQGRKAGARARPRQRRAGARRRRRTR